MKPLALILESTVAEDCPAAEWDDIRQMTAEVEAALAVLGYRTGRIPFTLDLAAMRDAVLAQSPSVLFNLVDCVEGKGDWISLAPLLAGALGIPCTGADAPATLLTCDKLLLKRTLALHDLPHPATAQAERWIVKSVTEHASHGLFADSVVEERDVPACLADRQVRYGGRWYAEAYIAGREFNIGLLAENAGGVQALPPAEIVFTEDFPAGTPRMLGYDAKWNMQSPECQGIEVRYGLALAEPILAARLASLALRAWDAFDLAGYARVDFRVDSDGNPFLLEVNSNPSLTPLEDFCTAAAQAGVSYHRLIHRILAAAYLAAGHPLPKELAA